MEHILIIESDILLAKEIKKNIESFFDSNFIIDISYEKESAKELLSKNSYCLAIVSYQINNEKKGESLNFVHYNQIPTLVLLDNLNKKHIKKINELNVIDYIIKSKLQDKSYLNIIIDRIQKEYNDVSFDFKNNIFNSSISMGTVILHVKEFDDINIVIQKADQNLYNSKNNGRNKLSKSKFVE